MQPHLHAQQFHTTSPSTIGMVIKCRPGRSHARFLQARQEVVVKSVLGRCHTRFLQARQEVVVKSVLGAAQLQPGSILQNRYTILGVLGSGSFGTTYKALTPSNGLVALKTVSLRGLEGWKQLELFEREVSTLKSLVHPAIPRYVDDFQVDTTDDRRFYLVQDLVEGRTLTEMVKNGMRPAEKEVERIAVELLSLLEYLASLRPPTVHRDVKPENIMLEGGEWGGRIFLVDFGSVQAAATVGKVNGSTVFGTYGYMAPEQFQGSAEPASDMYGLGATLLFLLSGQAPITFPQERMRLRWEDQVKVGPRLRAVLAGLLQPLAEKRLKPESALSMLQGEKLAREDKSVIASKRGAGRVIGDGSRASTARLEVQRTKTSMEITIKPFQNWQCVIAEMVYWCFSIPILMLGAAAVIHGLTFKSSAFLVLSFFVLQLYRSTYVNLFSTQVIVTLGSNKAEVRYEPSINREEYWGGFFRKKRKVLEGGIGDLWGASVIIALLENGHPRTAVQIVAGDDRIVFGKDLSLKEHERLVCDINTFLHEVNGVVMPAEELPQPKPQVWLDIRGLWVPYQMLRAKVESMLSPD